MPKRKEEIATNIINSKNEPIVKEFEKLIEQIKVQIDIAPSTSQYLTNNYRLKQIGNALQIIKKYPKEIKSGEQLKDFEGIGKGTISRINEILKTGSLSEIKVTKSERKYSDYIKELEQIHGIGHKTAYELVTKHGIKSIKDLKKAYNEGTIQVTNIVLTALKYHGIYEKNIPRSEIDKIYEYLLIKAKTIDNDLSITICGSYRRLRPTSNDVDVLVIHPSIKTKLQLENQPKAENYLLRLIRLLRDDKFLLDNLTDKDYEIKYMGFCQLVENNHEYPVRRIDFRYLPAGSYPAAILYFTGNAEFNKRMRGLAEQLGYTLNEYGLYKLEGNKKIRIETKTEKDIFDKLGMEYLPPEKRN